VPRATRITHPAQWADARLNVLRAAVSRAELPNAVLIAEPVAAAAWIAMATTKPGGLIAVYDFGGGTFDAAVLRRTDNGFEVAGPPSGRDPLGGEDLDRCILGHLANLLAEEHPEQWPLLMNPPDASWRRAAAGLREEVQRAKEMLSDVLVCQLWVPGIEREVQLTRGELDEQIGGHVTATVESLVEAIDAAGITTDDLTGVYLVGGSSRIPLVADTIWRDLHVRPAVQDNPKSVVAMGAAAWGTASPPAPRPAPPRRLAPKTSQVRRCSARIWCS
jgi:molecular chaperone DnaK (HSP70)